MGKLVKIMSMNVDSHDGSGSKIFKEVWLNPDKVIAVYPWYVYHISHDKDDDGVHIANSIYERNNISIKKDKSICIMGSIIELDSPILSYNAWNNDSRSVSRTIFVPYNVDTTVRILHNEMDLKNAAVIECPFPMDELTPPIPIC